MTMNLSATMNFTMKAHGTQAIANQTTKIADEAERAQRAMSKTGAGGLRRSGGGSGGGGGGGGGRGDGDGASPNEYRVQRSTAGTRGAAGRNFAGLAQASGETSGFVAAYATLAANIFALTAAFKALSDAAKFVQLQKGLELVGAQAGTTLSITAKKMEELSGFAISTVEAMKSVASATAAGFSGKDIERLTKVAKGASTALGRDMSDAMDRLTRGTIKLEPELLDELGIMTRLDEATRNYAYANRVAASSLSATQKRQAFLNAVLAEGEQKFGAISDSVEVSVYDKLAASMKKFGTETLAVINGPIKFLIDALVAVPALGIFLALGVLRTAVGKLIPDLGVVLSRQTDRFSKAVQDASRLSRTIATFKNKNEAKEELSSFAQARYQSLMMKNVDVMETKSTKSILKEIQIVQKDNVLIQKQMGTASNVEKVILENKLRLNREIEASLRNQLVGIKKEGQFGTAVANQQNITNTARSRAAITRKLQSDLERAGGTIGGTLGAFGSAYSGAFSRMGREMDKAGKEAAKVNRELGNSKNLLGAMNTAGSVFGAGMRGVGTIVGITGQAIQSMAGYLFAAFAIIQLIMSLWPMIEEHVFGVTKRVKELREELKVVTENAIKTGSEIRKFQEIGLFGKAIDAASNSMTELYNKTKELNEERRKGDNKLIEDSTKYGILNKKDKDITGFVYGGGEFSNSSQNITSQANFGQNLAAMGVKQDTIKTIGATGDLLGAFGSKIQDTFIAKVKELADNPEALNNYLLETQGRFGDSLGAMGDFDAAAKELGKSLVKLRTPDVFITPYTPVLDQIRAMDNSYKNIMKTFEGLDIKSKDATNAFAGLGRSMASTYEGVAEIDRLLGGNSGIFAEYTKRTEAAAKLASEKLKENNEAGIAAAQEGLNKVDATIGRMFGGSIAVNAELSNSKVVLEQAALEGLKLQDSFAGLVADGMKFNNSIKSINKEMTLLDKTGSSEKGIFGSAVAQVQAAEEARDIAIQTSSIKMEVIKAEFNLLEAQRQQQMLGITDKLNSPELRAAAQQARQLKEYPNITLGFAATAEELKTAQNYYAILDLLKDQEQSRIKIRDESIANIGRANALAQKQVDLEYKKLEAYNAVENIEKRRLEILQEQINSSRTFLTLQKDLFGSQQTLEKLGLEKEAFKNFTSVSPQDTYELEKKKLEKDIGFAETEARFLLEEHDLKMALYEAEFDLNRMRLVVVQNELDDIIKNPKSTKEQIANAQRAMGIGNAYEGNLIEAFNSFTANSARQRSVLAETGEVNVSIAKAILDAFKSPAELFFNDLIRQLNAGRLGIQKAAGSVGMNMVGAGGIANPLIDQYWTQVGQTKFGGDYDKFINSEDVKLIKEASYNLAEMAVIAEGVTKISTAFHEELAGAFTSIIDGSKDAGEAFADMALSMLKMIAQLIAQLLAMAAIKATARMFNIPLADGGIMPGAQAMASGGIMNRATSSGHQGVINKPTYLVGEGRYNEAVVPLPNGRAIPVQMHGNNTSSNNVQVNVNLSQNGEARTSTQGPDMNNLGAAIAAAVQKELLVQKAPGGILSRYGVA